MTAKRLLPAVLMLGIFFVVVLYEPLVFVFPLLVLVFGGLTLWETVALFRKKHGLRISFPICVLISLALLVDGFWTGLQYGLYILALGTVLLLSIRVLRSDHDRIASEVGAALLAVAYIGLPMAMAVAIMHRPGPEEFYAGPYHLIFLIAVIFSGDSGAYFIGRKWGKHPFFPKLSPNKTLEGAIGSVAVSLIIAFFMVQFVPALHALYGYWHGMILGLVLAIAAPLGDLAESAVKRNAGEKDSSNLIAGHGGFLDVFDSLIFGLFAQFGYIQLVLANF